MLKYPVSLFDTLSVKLQRYNREFIQLMKENLKGRFHCNGIDNKYGYIQSQKGTGTVVFLYPVNSGHYPCKEIIRIFKKTDIAHKVILSGANYDPCNHLFRKNKLYEAEIIGLFYCLGYNLLNSRETASKKIFCFEKTTQNTRIKKYPYSPLIKLERIGKNGKIINIYKIRTMHPYAEYMQGFMVDRNKYGRNGKINDDFRITPFGKFLRKYFLDELPQIINLLKGDLRLVGCRAVSEIYLRGYPSRIYNLRIKNKPGIITPAAADRAKSVEEVMESELNYLNKRLTNPVKTDLTVFFKALRNFLTGAYKGA